jgi:hypothetical protein
MKRPATQNQFGYRSFYRRNLPHIQPLNAALFLTFRLAGSLPKEVLGRMLDEKLVLEKALKNDLTSRQSRFRSLARRHFAMLENWLDKAAIGPTWLADERIAGTVAEALHYRDGKATDWTLFQSCRTMSTLFFAPLATANTPESLSSIMHSLKRNTAKRANKVLGRSGAFWEHESFDHYVRNRSEWLRVTKYVLENPVKAGLVSKWEDWPWNYFRDPLWQPIAN